MRQNLRYAPFVSTLLLLACAFTATAVPSPASAPPQSHATAQTTSANTDADPFDVMMRVVTHQRCMNCHPKGDRPRQGDDSHLHHLNVQRGPTDHGVAALQCATCHQSENNDYSGVPGAPHWGLAPLSMGWEGMSATEIATAMLDQEKNGGRSLADIVRHLTEDELVLWAFEPGLNNEGEARTKPPVGKAEFIAAVKAWADAGAVIPTEGQ